MKSSDGVYVSMTCKQFVQGDWAKSTGMWARDESGITLLERAIAKINILGAGSSFQVDFPEFVGESCLVHTSPEDEIFWGIRVENWNLWSNINPDTGKIFPYTRLVKSRLPEATRSVTLVIGGDVCRGFFLKEVYLGETPPAEPWSDKLDLIGTSQKKWDSSKLYWANHAWIESFKPVVGGTEFPDESFLLYQLRNKWHLAQGENSGRWFFKYNTIPAQVLYDLREKFEFCPGSDLVEFIFDQTGSQSGRAEIKKIDAHNFVYRSILAEICNSFDVKEEMKKCLKVWTEILRFDETYDVVEGQRVNLGTIVPMLS